MRALWIKEEKGGIFDKSQCLDSALMSRGSETPVAVNQTASVGPHAVCCASVNALSDIRKGTKGTVQGMPSNVKGNNDGDRSVRMWTKRNGHVP